MASTCSHASCGCVIFIEELNGPHIVEKGKCMNCDHAVNLHPRKPAQGNTFFREHHLFSFIVLHFVCCLFLSIFILYFHMAELCSDKLIFPSAAAQQSIDFRARFEALLRQGGIRPKPSLLSRLQKVRETAIITAGTVVEAVQWYEWIKYLPESVTRGIFLNATGYELDGMHPQFDGILLAGDDEGRSYMFKLTPPESDEAFFATRVRGKPYLVASSYERAEQEDANGVKHACGGLLMRKFDRSLFGHDFQCSAAVLLRRCKAMITAINAMHNDRIVHMDLKEANIFVRDGLWFVGDFGSCVYHHEPIRSTTEGCYPAARNMIIGTPARWHHDWFALALVFANQLRVHGEPIEVSVEGFRDRVLASINANCEVEELGAMLTAMVDCDEQYMRFEGQADFAAVTDKVIIHEN